MDSLKNKRLIASVTNRMGILYNNKSDYPKALQYFNRALNAAQNGSDTYTAMFAKNNLGMTYWNQGNLLQALDYYFESLKDADKLKDQAQMAVTLSNIGLIYWTQKNYNQAFEFMFKALAIERKLGNKIQIARNLGNISSVYIDLADNTNAMTYNMAALRLREELNDKKGIALSYGIIADVNANRGDSAWMKGNIRYAREMKYPDALTFYTKALKLEEQIGELSFQVNFLNNMGRVQTRMGRLPEAEHLLLRAMKLGDSLGTLNQQQSSHEYLSDLYEAKGDYKKAYEHHKAFTIARDSLFNRDKSMEANRKSLSYEYDKRSSLQRAEQDKKDVLAAAESRKQKIIIWSVAAGLLLVIVFASFISRSLRITQKQKRIIERQKGIVEDQKKVVEKQKYLVEENQKEILDSITYAKRLQRAILPPESLIKLLLKQSFVLYIPKAVVAGDFYWMFTHGDTVLIAAADCTGHGVPGAMVSIVCSNALKRAVNEFGLTDTGKILDKTTELVLETFADSYEDIKDGMDISLLSINKVTHQLQWSGANNPLWMVKNGELKEIKGDKQPIGKSEHRKPFISHDLHVAKGDCFYLITDGYADQFGGAGGKKYKYKQLKDSILAIADLPMREQQQRLGQMFNDWKGDLEQVDDVTLIGIRI